MARVYTLVELTSLSGDERLYIVDDPTGTPLNRYVDITTLDGRWAAISGGEPVNTVAVSGATQTLTLAPKHHITMSESCTITLPTPTTDGFTFDVYVSGAFTLTLSAGAGSIVWDSGTPPTYASPSIFTFTTYNGTSGTPVWYGALVGSAFA